MLFALLIQTAATNGLPFPPCCTILMKFWAYATMWLKSSLFLDVVQHKSKMSPHIGKKLPIYNAQHPARVKIMHYTSQFSIL